MEISIPDELWDKIMDEKIDLEKRNYVYTLEQIKDLRFLSGIGRIDLNEPEVNREYILEFFRGIPSTITQKDRNYFANPIYKYNHYLRCKFLFIPIWNDVKPTQFFDFEKERYEIICEHAKLLKDIIVSRTEEYLLFDDIKNLIIENTQYGFNIWIIFKKNALLKDVRTYYARIMPKLNELFYSEDNLDFKLLPDIHKIEKNPKLYYRIPIHSQIEIKEFDISEKMREFRRSIKDIAPIDMRIYENGKNR